MECNPKALIYYPRSTKVYMVKNREIAFLKKSHDPAGENPCTAQGLNQLLVQVHWCPRVRAKHQENPHSAQFFL